MRNDQLDSKDLYIKSLYPLKDPGLSGIEQRLRDAGRWGVNVSANEGRLLALLIRLGKVQKAVEIGTLYGYSAVWIARALPENGHLYAIERDPVCVAAAKLGFAECGVGDRVTLFEGDAELELLKIEAQLGQNATGTGCVDLVFIDANKSAYPRYLDWAERCVRPGGLIVADNVFLGGHACQEQKPSNISQAQWSGMREFNARLADPSRFTSVILPTSEGLTVAIRN